MKSKRSKACDIPQSVKKRVFIRDNGMCVVCHNRYNVMPNGHYIPRSKGGLGIVENIVTLCTELTENKCHSRFDKGTKEERDELGFIIKTYLKSKHPNWDEEKLVYKKGGNYGNKK